MESRDGRGSPADDRAAIRARFVAVLNAKLAELIEGSPGTSDPPPMTTAARGTESSTVGTGSFVAIGCSVVTLVVLMIGILVLVLTRWI